LSCSAQGNILRQFEGTEFMNAQSPISDSLIEKMTIEEQIGQLFMIAAWSNKGEEHKKQIENLIKEHNIGGLIYFQGGPKRQFALNKNYQGKSKIPLLIGMDAEWGLSMRLDSTLKYPYQMTLGAIQNDTLIYDMGKSIAYQLKNLGVHVNFAPVADVNNNSENPVINYRSFGENVRNVSVKSLAYVEGLQDNGIMANAKHFPGHGDTDVDSHKGLPNIEHSKLRLDSIELMPFKYLISRGVGSIMVAHLYIPSLDSTKNQASTLSPNVVDSLLKKALGFNGLIFTDALNMKGVSKFYEPGETDEKAFIAGNDVLLFTLSVKKARERILKAIENGSISKNDIRDRCYKILKAKEWLGLFKDAYPSEYDPTAFDKLEDKSLIDRLYSESVTLVKNEEDLVPIKRFSKKERVLIIVGDYLNNSFHKDIKTKKLTHAIAVKKEIGKEKVSSILKKLENVEEVIVNLHSMSQQPKKDFGLNKSLVAFIDSLNKKHKVVLNVFGNPYALSKFPDLLNCEAVFVFYEDNMSTHLAATKALFGEANITGELPVSINEEFKEGTGIRVVHNKLTYGYPEEVGMSTNKLHLIDSIVVDGLNEQAYPGCVVLVAKDQKIVYHKSFGHNTYEGKKKIEVDDIYDLASITKIAATAAAAMKLSEEGALDINKTIGHYLSNVPDTSFIHDLKLKDVMTHQSGLKPWIPFYAETMTESQYKDGYYSKSKTDKYNIQVCKNLWISDSYQDSIFSKLCCTQPRTNRDYKYSDLGFYLLPLIIESITGDNFEDYLIREFYNPLGVESLVFNPLEVYDKKRIVPTEHDMYFRRELLQGYVHDMGAAMLGGVSGHAGLFGNANDLAIYMQMLINGGVYNNQRILEEKTVNEFTSCQFCDGSKKENRRGLIFDKPSRFEEEGPTCNDCISHSSFGHSGFTGTYAWADPEEDLVYIFLSNRIYPSMNNKKLIKMNIRTKIMQAIYDSIEVQKSYSNSH